MIDTGMGWALFGMTFIFIFILLGILAESVRRKSKLARQELLQKERLFAMEKGLPLPEWGDAMLDDAGGAVSSEVAYKRRREWFKLVSLCIGLVLTFGGIGMMLAFHYSFDESFRDIETIGGIPFMSGLGLLLFYFLTRNQD